MPFPKPSLGLIIRYSYLWHAEDERGLEEGLKNRPCAVIFLSKDKSGESETITVLPVTHTPPSNSEAEWAVEIPPETKRRLGLDDSRSWVMVNEANRFTWPGPDLRIERNGDPSSIVIGKLPEKLFERIRLRFVAAAETSRAKIVNRTE